LTLLPRATQRTPMRLLVGVFVLLAIVTTAQTVLSRRASGEAGEFWLTMFYSASIWATWVALVPVIVWLGRRFDFGTGHRTLSGLIHLVAALIVHAITMLLGVVLGVALYSPEETITWEMIQRAVFLSSRLPLSIIIYAGIIGLDRALGLWHALADREVQSVRLEAQATRARLDALAARLHPHFLFNALQSVSALIDEDPARARSMLAQIGDLLRDVLAVPDDGDVPLQEEIALLSRYLAIEEIRFADRLRVEIEVSPEVAAFPVPRLLLQPLAENALRHGLAPLPSGGTLRITAIREGERVRITMHNNGVPLSTAMRQGVGLAMTRERLAARYGNAASFALRQVPDGVEALLELPA
jgi:two-component system LytT family sensor kinase